MIRVLAELVRAPAALTVPGDVLAGAVASGNLRAGRVIGLAASSVCIYWAGMALNDWADRDVDAIERPDRPIPSGRVSASVALVLASGLTAAGLGLARAAGGSATFRTSTALAATAWAYDLGGKNTPAGPFLMATARSLDVLVGAGSSRRRAWAPALVVGTHILGVTLMSRNEVHGGTPHPARTALAATSLITAATALPAATGLRGTPGLRGVTGLGGAGLRDGLIAAGLAGLFARAVGPAQWTAAQQPDGLNIRMAVASGIHGLVPLQAAWCARNGASRVGLGLVAALPLARALARKISPT
ncbi:UbiA family prenyltransferase [Kribbella sp. NBC_01245]|uniref:SCO3242 family prenyltransferase n=1 Tax=Kribbella sp. NBC_01245 TaxID=2903578 RepID=UPI002E2CAEA4|nr:UbiA family prenyltransferase [Kribbella sp. NBC_01245]